MLKIQNGFDDKGGMDFMGAMWLSPTNEWETANQRATSYLGNAKQQLLLFVFICEGQSC